MAKQFSILLAEDEESDVFLLRQAMKKAGLPHRLVVAQDGQEAVDYLNGEAPYTNRTQYPLPDLLLLDLKMPRLSGFDVLVWLRERPDLKTLPAVVLTSSADEADRKRARELGAADYQVKPSDFPGLVKTLQEIQARWLGPQNLL